MDRGRLIALFIGAALLAAGVGLILYGNTLPSDFVVHGLWDYSNQDEVNILMLIGFILIFVGASFLLYGIFARSKSGRADS